MCETHRYTSTVRETSVKKLWQKELAANYQQELKNILGEGSQDTQKQIMELNKKYSEKGMRF